MKKKANVQRVFWLLPRITFILLLLCCANIQAQERMDREAWKEATEGVNYDEEPEPEEERAEQAESPQPQPSGDWLTSLFESKTLSVLFISLIIIVLALVIVKLFGANFGSGKARAKKNLSFSLEDIEENLTETELERFRREALEKHDYKTAIRIHYLMIIKELTKDGKIDYKKEKTNRHYVLEMRRQDDYRTFRDLTRSFEIVWYGEAPFSADEYQKIFPAFSHYLKSLEMKGADAK